MYCATCGKALLENQHFCNNCGARTGRGEMTTNSLTGSTVAVAWIGVAGLIGFIAVLKILLESRLDPSAMVIILLAYLVTVFLLCAMMIGQFWKKPATDAKSIQPDEYLPPKNFRATGVETARLNEYHEPASVVENTTRTLDQELVERK